MADEFIHTTVGQQGWLFPSPSLLDHISGKWRRWRRSIAIASSTRAGVGLSLPGHWEQCACLLADTHLLRDVRCWQCYTRALWRLLVPTDFSLSGSVKQVNYSTWINNAREQVILFLKGAGEFVISNRGGLLWSTLCLLERTSDLRVCLWGRLLGSNWTKRIRYKTSMKKN